MPYKNPDGATKKAQADYENCRANGLCPKCRRPNSSERVYCLPCRTKGAGTDKRAKRTVTGEAASKFYANHWAKRVEQVVDYPFYFPLDDAAKAWVKEHAELFMESTDWVLDHSTPIDALKGWI